MYENLTLIEHHISYFIMFTMMNEVNLILNDERVCGMDNNKKKKVIILPLSFYIYT